MLGVDENMKMPRGSIEIAPAAEERKLIASNNLDDVYTCGRLNNECL